MLRVHGLLDLAQMGGGCPGTNWILRDEYSDTVAAGSVNGTLATPGPGTRSVTDTSTILSIGSGSVLVAALAPSANDPRLFYTETVARVAGRVLTIAHVNTTTYVYCGWSSGAPSTGSGQPLIVVNAPNASFRMGGGATVLIGNVADYTRYAAVLRSAGCYIFGYSGQWVLLMILASGVSTPLYVVDSLCAWNAVMNTNSSFLRVPDVLWLPTPTAFDSFTRANGPLGSTEILGPDAQSASALVWTNQVGTTLVAGNTAQASVLAGGVAIATVTGGSPNVLTSSALTVAAGVIGVVVRYADSSNYVVAYHDGANAHLDKVVAGVPTSLINAAAAYAAGRVLLVACEGTTFRMYYNEVQIGTTQTIADAALQSGVDYGLYSTNVGNNQDNFLVFGRGTAGEYGSLNAWGYA